jgi:hypothetical protein
MGIFSSIASAIFGSSKPAAASQPETSAVPGGATGGAGGTTVGGGTAGTGGMAGASGSTGGMAGAAATAPTGGRSPPPMSTAEVEGMIAGIADRRPGKFDWQHSIVDLMKLLDIDSSLSARKELARELGYSGALDGSAEMNIWLHRQVMQQLAASGGRVPDSLRH